MALAALPVAWDRVLADAAFDSEARHAYARGCAGDPAGRYRVEMARWFQSRPEGSRSKRVYGQR